LACNGRKSGYRCWPGILRCLPVLADQPDEPGPALDPGGRDGEGDEARVVARCPQAEPWLAFEVIGCCSRPRIVLIASPWLWWQGKAQPGRRDRAWDRAGVVGRLDVLRRADPGFTRFGAAAHHYLLNQPLPQSEVTAFEARSACRCPGNTAASSWRSATGAPARSTGSSASIAPISLTRAMTTCCPAFWPGSSPTRSPGTTSATTALNPRRSTSTRPAYAVP
jgi:hypothetical protein